MNPRSREAHVDVHLLGVGAIGVPLLAPPLQLALILPLSLALPPLCFAVVQGIPSPMSFAQDKAHRRHWDAQDPLFPLLLDQYPRYTLPNSLNGGWQPQGVRGMSPNQWRLYDNTEGETELAPTKASICACCRAST